MSPPFFDKVVYPGHWRGLDHVTPYHKELRNKCSKLHRMNQTPGETAWDELLQYVDRNKAAYIWPHASATDTLPASNNTAEVRTESTRTRRKVGALWDMDRPPDDLGQSPRKAADKTQQGES